MMKEYENVKIEVIEIEKDDIILSSRYDPNLDMQEVNI